MENQILKVNEVTYSYGKNKVLSDFSFSARKGEILIIAGPNGSGKTTLIKNILGILTADSGEILIDNIDNNKIESKKKMLYLASENTLPTFLTGDEYIKIMCRMYDVDIDKNKYSMLVDYYNMKNFMNEMIENFSHGMVKKIQLILAFLLQVDITIIDETLNGIDVHAREVSKVLIKKLAKKNKLVVFCTHDLEMADIIADRILLIYQGEKRIEIDKHTSDKKVVDVFKEIIDFKESEYEI